jgi:hypothetical protein
LDSGGFTELAMHGWWTVDAATYAADVRRYRDGVGSMAWAAPQDWMCEPAMLARTGLTVAEHQRRTVDNYLQLRTIADDVPFVPVLQGWTRDNYWRHVDQYAAAGVDLTAAPLVGLGSVCRRQATDEIAQLVGELSASIRLHGFGVKRSGLAAYGWMLTSADSLAWSYDGRRIRPCPHTGAVSCANCIAHAVAWADGVTVGNRPVQLAFPAC